MERGLRPRFGVRPYAEEGAYGEAAESVVLHDHRPPRGHVERLALQTLHHAILYRHCPRASHDERLAPHRAHPHTVQHERVVNLDVVHRPARHLIPEPSTDHSQVAHVELLERLRLDALDAAILQPKFLRVHEIGERERAQLADPHVLQDDRLHVPPEHETWHGVDAAVPHRYPRARALGGELETLPDQGQVGHVDQVDRAEADHRGEARVGQDHGRAIAHHYPARVRAQPFVPVRG